MPCGLTCVWDHLCGFAGLSWSPGTEHLSTHTMASLWNPAPSPQGSVREVNLGDALRHLVAQAVDQSPAPSWTGLPGPGSAAPPPGSSRSGSKGLATSLRAPSTKPCGLEGCVGAGVGEKALWPASPGALAEEGRCPWTCGRGRGRDLLPADAVGGSPDCLQPWQEGREPGGGQQPGSWVRHPARGL